MVGLSLDVIPSEARNLQCNAVPTAAPARFLAAKIAMARNDNQIDPMPPDTWDSKSASGFRPRAQKLGSEKDDPHGRAADPQARRPGEVIEVGGTHIGRQACEEGEGEGGGDA